MLDQLDGRRGKQIVARCALAANLGISVGMSLAEATASITVPMTVLPYEPAKDRKALGNLAETCERFSPIVGWDSLTPRLPVGQCKQPAWFGESPKHLFLDVSGLAHLFGGEKALAGEILTACQAVGYAAHIAITDTLGASWALAASSNPVSLVSSEELRTALGGLFIDRLRIPGEAQDLLARLGVQTIQQLTQLPRADLAARFGSLVLLRIDQALGTIAETVTPHRPPPRFEAYFDMEYPSDQREVLACVIADLLEHITAILRTRGVGAIRLIGRMICTAGKPVALEVGVFRPTVAGKQLADLLGLQLDRIKLPGHVKRIELRVDRVAPLVDRPGQLFAGDDCYVAREWAALVERLTSRLGSDAVVRPELLPDAAPEHAYRYVPLLGSLRLRTSRAGPAAASHRPLRFINPPQRIDAVSVVPDGPPIAFHWHRTRHVIARHWGPELIETGWRCAGTVRRDYYRVETDAGRRFWLFRDLSVGDWHMHGSFD